MAEDSDLERTEPASSRRIEKAREEGNVPHSRELMAFLVMASAVAGIWTLGGWFAHRAGDVIRHGLSFGRDAAFDTFAMSTAFTSLAWDGLTLTAPLLILTVAAALITPFLLGGWNFSPSSLSVNLDRLNPLQGLKRMFSVQSVAELVKALLKSALIGGISPAVSIARGSPVAIRSA